MPVKKNEDGLPLNQTLSTEQCLFAWVKLLQKLLIGEEGPEMLMVKGMGGDDLEWTEVNLEEDDPTNITDGTWTEPQIWS